MDQLLKEFAAELRQRLGSRVRRILLFALGGVGRLHGGISARCEVARARQDTSPPHPSPYFLSGVGDFISGGVANIALRRMLECIEGKRDDGGYFSGSSS